MRYTMRMMLAMIVVIALMGVSAQAATIVFDMTDNGEGLALENTGEATKSGVKMSANTNVDAAINAISSRLGINFTGSDDESSLFDDSNGDNTGTAEFLSFSFDADVTLDSIDFTDFGTNDQAKLTIGTATPTVITNSNDTNPFVVNESVSNGTPIILEYEIAGGGNGWGIEAVTISVIPTPAALPAGLAMLGLITMRRRRR